MVEDGAFKNQIDYITIFKVILNLEGHPNCISYWFKSYGDLAEWVDFAYWWIFSGGGSAIIGATASSSLTHIEIF